MGAVAGEFRLWIGMAKLRAMRAEQNSPASQAQRRWADLRREIDVFRVEHDLLAFSVIMVAGFSGQEEEADLCKPSNLKRG